MLLNHTWWPFGVLLTTCPDKSIWELVNAPIGVDVDLLASLDVVVVRKLIRIYL
jgi:hypothetical protein